MTSCTAVCLFVGKSERELLLVRRGRRRLKYYFCEHLHCNEKSRKPRKTWDTWTRTRRILDTWTGNRLLSLGQTNLGPSWDEENENPMNSVHWNCVFFSWFFFLSWNAQKFSRFLLFSMRFYDILLQFFMACENCSFSV